MTFTLCNTAEFSVLESCSDSDGKASTDLHVLKDTSTRTEHTWHSQSLIPDQQAELSPIFPKDGDEEEGDELSCCVRGCEQKAVIANGIGCCCGKRVCDFHMNNSMCSSCFRVDRCSICKPTHTHGVCEGCKHKFCSQDLKKLDKINTDVLCPQCVDFSRTTYSTLLDAKVPTMKAYAGANNISLKGCTRKVEIFTRIIEDELSRYNRDVFYEDQVPNNPFHKGECVTGLCQMNILRESVTEKYDAVAEYRGYTDIYTNTTYSAGVRDRREVDHIFEVQVMAHGAANALQNRAFNPIIYNGLRTTLNPDDLSNYNNVDKSFNVSKGAMFKTYLAGEAGIGWSGSGLSATALLVKNERFMVNVKKALQNVYPSIIENVAELKRPDNHITGEFLKVSEALGDLIVGMRLDEENMERQTRSMRRRRHHIQ